jgi:predicted dinucleotide-binding enzyme
MKFGVLGTGTVGRTLAAKLVELGHSVLVGTRNPAKTLAQADPDRMGNPPFGAWLKDNARVSLVTFSTAAAHGELVINATNGSATLDALKAAGADNLDGKVLVDIANPLDFSRGMPPSLFVCNTDSLAEQIQRAFPGARVVKTLNTMTAAMMVNPRQLAEGAHSVFVSGDDAAAKDKVTELLRSFGWEDVIDLGDLTSARAAEMVLPLWLRLMMVQGTPLFNFQIVHS